MTQGREPVSLSLLQAARRGEDRALRRLVERAYPTVRRWALVHLGDPDDAEDLTQDVMIRMLGRLDGFRGDSGFESWLYALTRNAAHDARRRRQRQRRVGADPRALPSVTPSAAPDPAARVRASEARARLRSLFRALPDRQREVFDLVELQGRTAAEVAELMGIRPVSVRAHLFKARRTMRRLALDGPKAMEESA